MQQNSVVVGNSLECALYCWKTQSKCLIQKPSYVFAHDLSLSDYDFSYMNTDCPKIFFDNLLFCLGFTSLSLFHGNIENVRETESGLEVITKRNRRVEIKTKEVVWFDQLNRQKNNVYDFFDIREMTGADSDRYIFDNSNFANQVDFYLSSRSNNGVGRDMVVSSIMTPEELLNPDFGHGIVMLKTIRELRKLGVAGKFSWERNGKKYYKRLKLEFSKRVVSPFVDTMYDFDYVYNLNQKRGEEWKMLEKLLMRAETS